jgi:DNA-binding Lrp family transcriptional regulator
LHKLLAMANEERIIKDPFGNQVRITTSICFIEINKVSAEIMDEALDVISKPALMIELISQPTLQLCYYRSVEWNTTLLIIADKVDEGFVAVKCYKNPTPQSISELLKRGRQLI